MRHSYTLRCCVLILFLVGLSSTSVFAQGVTTAAMNGKVTSKSSESLPGVNVVALHVPSGSTYGTSTRSDGSYNLPNLRVGGPYTVSASLVGYQKQTRENVYIRLSENFDLNFTLTEEAIQAGKYL